MPLPYRKPERWTLAGAVLAAALAAAPQLALAQSAAEKGLEIAREIDRRDLGFGDFSASMTMLLKNKRGDESLRYIRLRTLEVNGDGDKSMSIFDQPADVKGTAFLTHSHSKEPDDQWLYLPALKRIKRISSKNKSGPFMGSEFAYEDIASQEVDKYTYKLLREENLGGTPTFVLEQYPAYEFSGYTRQVAWIDKERYIPLKVEFYDRKDSHLKTLEMRGYQQYLGKHWRASEMYMENHQTGKSTLLTWSDYVFGNGFDDGDFAQNALKRIR